MLSAAEVSGGDDSMVHESRTQGQTRIHAHVKHLDDFFEGYVRNVRMLQKRLDKSAFPDDQGESMTILLYRVRLILARTETQDEQMEIDKSTYEALMQQFNMQLIIVRRLNRCARTISDLCRSRPSPQASSSPSVASAMVY